MVVISDNRSIPGASKRITSQELLNKLADNGGIAEGSDHCFHGDKNLFIIGGKDIEFPAGDSAFNLIALNNEGVIPSPAKRKDRKSNESKFMEQLKAESEAIGNPGLKGRWERLDMMKQLGKYEGSEMDYRGVRFRTNDLAAIAKHFSPAK